jgi:hypothetical protein
VISLRELAGPGRDATSGGALAVLSKSDGQEHYFMAVLLALK